MLNSLASKNAIQLNHSFKKESSIQKESPALNTDLDSTLSFEDFDMENVGLFTYKRLVCIQINLFDSRFCLLKEFQNRTQFHLPLFLRYYAIKIP